MHMRWNAYRSWLRVGLEGILYSYSRLWVWISCIGLCGVRVYCIGEGVRFMCVGVYGG